MSLLKRISRRLLKHNRHDEQLASLSLARCTDCGLRFWGRTETEAARQLSRHAVFTHDSPPDWDLMSQAVDEEIDFHANIRRGL